MNQTTIELYSCLRKKIAINLSVSPQILLWVRLNPESVLCIMSLVIKLFAAQLCEENCKKINRGKQENYRMERKNGTGQKIKCWWRKSNQWNIEQYTILVQAHQAYLATARSTQRFLHKPFLSEASPPFTGSSISILKYLLNQP